jgi:NTE family protein
MAANGRGAGQGLQGRIGIALGSGAARGFAHIGVVRALARAGIAPDVVCGTSMGAIVGAAVAAGQLDAFETWARGLEWRQIAGYLDITLRGGLIRARKLFEFIEDALAERRIEALGLPFAAVGTDLANGQEVWLREGALIEALRATVAIPGLITPVRWNGRWLVDGGLVNPVPVSLCRALGADSVIAVDLNTTLLGRRFQGQGAEAPREPGARASDEEASFFTVIADQLRERFGIGEEDGGLPSVFEVMANSLNIMQVRIGRSRMAGDPPEMLITPRMADYGIIDFDRADEAIAAGEAAAERALRQAALGDGD